MNAGKRLGRVNHTNLSTDTERKSVGRSINCASLTVCKDRTLSKSWIWTQFVEVGHFRLLQDFGESIAEVAMIHHL